MCPPVSCSSSLISVLRKRFGRRAFEPNLKEKIRAHLNSLDNEFETKSKTFQTKDGKPLQSSLSKTKNVKEFIDHIVELRGIEKPKLILGLDGDVRHLREAVIYVLAEFVR